MSILCLSRAYSAGLGADPVVGADEQTVSITWPTSIDEPIEVFALDAHQSVEERGEPVFTGSPRGNLVRLPRSINGRDLLYCRFLVLDKQGQQLIDPVWVSDVSTLPRWTHPIPWPDTLKGVSNPMDFDDLVDLGVRHVHVNIKLGDLLLPEDAPDPDHEFIRVVNGYRLRFSPRVVAQWDADISRMTRDGINVVAVFLNAIPEGAVNGDTLIHPDTDIEGAPFRLGAFSLAEGRAVATYIGTLGFLAERYSRADRKYGWIGGYIIGNEVDSHWTWHNMGQADLDAVASHYINELRLAWLAVRQHHSHPRIFASLTHSWDRPNSSDQLKNCAGRDLLNRLSELSRAGGDFDWHVAYHPYPQNLFEPKFWNDRMAMFGYDSPMITFKNIEILPAYLERPEMTYRGKPRRVILSEQGFHTPKGDEGESIQAAAFALAHHRIRRIDGIDAFILHRHVDAAGEGGLLLGLRHLSPPDAETGRLGAKKRSWYVFQAAETPAWERVAAFALPIAGYRSWAEADPRPGPFPDRAPEWDGFQKHQQVVFDLLGLLGEAEVENALQVTKRVVGLPDGGMAESLFLHPNGPSEPPATATYSLTLPADADPRLIFQTYLGESRGDGVVFRVRVDGDVVFEETVEDQTIRDHVVDLPLHAGKEFSLTLEVDCRANNHYDEAQWLIPAIVSAPENP